MVGMFLTGFDAPTLNTLFVDKNLRYHGLLQAYSRTNRIYDATKTFGNIVTFRDLEQSTIDSISIFFLEHTAPIIAVEDNEVRRLGDGGAISHFRSLFLMIFARLIALALR